MKKTEFYRNFLTLPNEANYIYYKNKRYLLKFDFILKARFLGKKREILLFSYFCISPSP